MKMKVKNKKSLISALSGALTFVKKYYVLFVIGACVMGVGTYGVYKVLIQKPTYIYAKVKVGQGYWWATTQKPTMWYLKAIQQAKEQKDLAGKPVAKILDVSYYPFYGSGQYDIYVTVKLKVARVGNKGTYNFNRETIGVSAPIDLEFPNVQFSGTIIALSTSPFDDKYVEKTVYLTKRIPFPWEYEQIEVGDTQSDGKRVVLEVLEKNYGTEYETALLQQGVFLNSSISSFTVKMKVLVKKVDDQYIFAEEYPITTGRMFVGPSTKKFVFLDYYITKVE